MDPEYRWLITALNAYALVDENEHRFDTLIDTLNQNINYLKTVVLARQGGGSSGSEEANPNDIIPENGDSNSGNGANEPNEPNENNGQDEPGGSGDQGGGTGDQGGSGDSGDSGDNGGGDNGGGDNGGGSGGQTSDGSDQ